MLHVQYYYVILRHVYMTKVYTAGPTTEKCELQSARTPNKEQCEHCPALSDWPSLLFCITCFVNIKRLNKSQNSAVFLYVYSEGLLCVNRPLNPLSV